MIYRDAVRELYFALFGSTPTDFYADLYFLIGKADPFNKERLRLGYPTEVKVWENWQASDGSLDFFREQGGIRI